MPELPEVATVIKQISPYVTGQIISDVIITKKGERMISPLTPQKIAQLLTGVTVNEIKRHGKFIVFEMSDASKVVAHLRMSGRFFISDNLVEHSHNRILILLGNGKFLNFIDIRRFGTFHLVPKSSEYPGLKNLGPDALSPEFTAEYLSSQLQKRNKPVYSSLLDQSIVAGLGNIYVNEVLYDAKIHPQRSSVKITLKEAGKLIKSTIEILTMAINYRGTTLIDRSYADTEGLYGDFFIMLKVYGRKKGSCERCGSLIARIKIGGRSVYFCPGCQKL